MKGIRKIASPAHLRVGIAMVAMTAALSFAQPAVANAATNDSTTAASTAAPAAYVPYGQSAAPTTCYDAGCTEAAPSTLVKPASWLDDLVSTESSASTIQKINLTAGSTLVDVYLKKDSAEYQVELYNQASVEKMQQSAEAHGVVINVSDPSGNGWQALAIMLLLALVIIGGVFTYRKFIEPWLEKRAGGVPTQRPGISKPAQPQTGGKKVASPANGPQELKSGAMLFLPGQGAKVTMDMVIGQEAAKQDVEETIDFLKNPAKYAEMEARMPAGILFEGGPGLGKTLLAKAIATEAGVPMLSVTGSSFVEMYVGVGASRVRELFKEARSHAPCVIFIDEIDTVGAKRGNGSTGGHQEQEQTINALLAEMDGFSERTGIVIIGATNRKDMLDEALLRPKRFDRHVTFHSPSRPDREKILSLYLPAKLRGTDINVSDIARMTPGASGAILENIANEAKIAAVQADLKTITQSLLDEAVQKVTIGARRKGLMPSESDIHVTAVHEGGHARVFHKLSGRAPLRFTIVPRGNTGGHVQYDEDGEMYRTKEQFKTRLAVAMGGKAAVELHCSGQEDTGVSADLQSATQTAMAMVTEYGMSDLGYVSLSAYPNISLIPESLKQRIYEEVNKLLAEAYETAKRVITEDAEVFMRLVDTVKEKETVLSEDFEAIFGSASEPAA